MFIPRWVLLRWRTLCVQVVSHDCLLQTLAQKARAGKLQPHEFQGGTFRSVTVQPSATFLLLLHRLSRGAGIACWSEHRTRDQQVASSNPGKSGGRIFFFWVNFVCWLLFGVHSTPVLPQWHVKDPSHSAKSSGGRLHLNTHTPFTHQSWSGLTIMLSRQSVGIYREMSSQATRLGTLGHSRISSLCHCGLILA